MNAAIDKGCHVLLVLPARLLGLLARFNDVWSQGLGNRGGVGDRRSVGAIQNAIGES